MCLEIVLKCFKSSLFFCNLVVERFRLASDALYILFLLSIVVIMPLFLLVFSV